jgi:malate synthase
MGTTSQRLTRSGLQVDAELCAFIEQEAVHGSGLTSETVWATLAALVEEMSPRNRELLETRQNMQAALDHWHRSHPVFDLVEYKAYLYEIGYIVAQGPDFVVTTDSVDAEIAHVAGPQLVVPVTNARYALNAANARWGSLYDALYGTDAFGDSPSGSGYDPERGARVIQWVRDFLDEVLPLAEGSHHNATSYAVINGDLLISLDNGTTALADPDAFVGYQGDPTAPTSLLCEHHGLGIEIVIDPDHQVGSIDRAHVADVVLESAVTAIMDCEDSVATVDGADKTLAYRNWLGLMQGTLSSPVSKGGRTFTRSLHRDRRFLSPSGDVVVRPGRSLMLVRNVGHLMTTPAVLDAQSNPVFEGLLDAVITVLCALHDIRREDDTFSNSRAKSVYVVKPKMHGPEEVAFTNDIFSRIEELFGLRANTVKIGIMDEERRTTVNLAECIRAASSRVAFINTGFLDRTGDEMHTSMHAGPMVRKNDMRTSTWLQAYENWNVDTGLACGLVGRAQIGKGMWAAPDLMSAMLDQKISHPMAGANCAWVPSPTAATLHATHYHRVDVHERQRELLESLSANGPRATIDDLLQIPVAVDASWTSQDIQDELDNNAQGILGYVVRWVDHGVGCSKVPDINNVGLMEDRATCRISSQHMANWLLHGVVTVDQIQETFRRMAAVVDAQNADDPEYQPMAPACDGPAFRAATQLVLSGVEQPSGYTEPILHAFRLEKKGE